MTTPKGQGPTYSTYYAMTHSREGEVATDELTVHISSHSIDYYFQDNHLQFNKWGKSIGSWKYNKGHNFDIKAPEAGWLLYQWKDASK